MYVKMGYDSNICFHFICLVDIVKVFTTNWLIMIYYVTITTQYLHVYGK